jgi:hypothetical protein
MMATKPKPKPEPDPEPEPDEPKPDPDINHRIEALFLSQVVLIERIDKLEERIRELEGPPIKMGQRA